MHILDFDFAAVHQPNLFSFPKATKILVISSDILIWFITYPNCKLISLFISMVLISSNFPLKNPISPLVFPATNKSLLNGVSKALTQEPSENEKIVFGFFLDLAQS